MIQFDVDLDNLTQVVNKVPKTPGVYGFKDDAGIFLYIGQSIRLKDRLSQHAQDFLKRLINEYRACYLLIAECAPETLDQTEKQLIDKYTPRFNKNFNQTYDDPSLTQRVSIDIPTYLFNKIQDGRAKGNMSLEEFFKLSIEHMVDRVTIYDFNFN